MAAQQQEIDQQKAALLAAIAQQGSQGQQAFAAEQARRQQQQQAAVQAVASNAQMTGAAGSAPREFVQQLQGQQTALGDIYAQDAAMSGKAFQNSIAQTAASNAAYMDQARAAVPIVNAQTAGQVAQIRAQQQAEAEQRRADAEARAFDMEQRRLQAEEDAKDRAFAEEQRRWEREDRETVDGEEELVKKQDGLVTRADAYDPIFGNAYRAVVDDFNPNGGFKEAVIIADRAIAEAKAAAEAAKPGSSKSWDENKKRKLLRELYNFYNVDGAPAPTNTQEFGELMRSQGLDPRRVPGYDPNAKTKAKIAKGRTKAPDRGATPKKEKSPVKDKGPSSADVAAMRAARDTLRGLDKETEFRVTEDYLPTASDADPATTLRWIQWVRGGAKGRFIP